MRPAPSPPRTRAASRRSTRATPRRRTPSAADDYEGAVAEYQKLVDANPADAEAAAGLAMAKLLLRTKDVDLDEARAAAAAAPDDVAAQTLVADLDMLGGHVEDAFDRLVELVRRTAGDERNAAREHLVGLSLATARCRSATTTRGCSRAARPWRSRSSEQRATGTQSTGRLARCSSLCGVEPRSAPRIGLSPSVPTTMTVASSWSPTWISASAGLASTSRTLAVTPAASAFSRALRGRGPAHLHQRVAVRLALLTHARPAGAAP